MAKGQNDTLANKANKLARERSGLYNPNLGFHHYIADETGIEKETLKKYNKISSNIELGLRRPDLTFSHHEQVAFIEPKHQKRILQQARRELIGRRAAIADAQDIAEAVIYAEARLGELLKEIPKNRDKESSLRKTSLPSLPEAISNQDWGSC